MTLKDFDKIQDLFNQLKEEKTKKGELIKLKTLDTKSLLQEISHCIMQRENEVNGIGMVFDRYIDKLFYETQERIKKVVLEILNEELDKTVLKENDLQLKIKNVEVKM